MELNFLLTTQVHDGTNPEFKEFWSNVLNPASRPSPQPPASSATKQAKGAPGSASKQRPQAPETIVRPFTRESEL